MSIMLSIPSAIPTEVVAPDAQLQFASALLSLLLLALFSNTSPRTMPRIMTNSPRLLSHRKARGTGPVNDSESVSANQAITK